MDEISMIGQTVSHYRITAKLGSGGMGQVYLEQHTKLGRSLGAVLCEMTARQAPILRRDRDRNHLTSLVAELYAMGDLPKALEWRRAGRVAWPPAGPPGPTGATGAIGATGAVGPVALM